MDRIIPPRKPLLSQEQIAEMKRERESRQKRHIAEMSQRKEEEKARRRAAMDFQGVFQQIESESDGTDS